MSEAEIIEAVFFLAHKEGKQLPLYAVEQLFLKAAELNEANVVAGRSGADTPHQHEVKVVLAHIATVYGMDCYFPQNGKWSVVLSNGGLCVSVPLG